MRSSAINRTAAQRTKWVTFIYFLKTRPVIMIFAFICIAAGLVLGGIFIGKVLNPIEIDTSAATDSTKQISVYSGNNNYLHQKCVDDLEPFRKFCQIYVGMNCSESLLCQKNCLKKYSVNCPCQVYFRFLFRNIYRLKTQDSLWRWMVMSEVWLLGSKEE